MSCISHMQPDWKRCAELVLRKVNKETRRKMPWHIGRQDWDHHLRLQIEWRSSQKGKETRVRKKIGSDAWHIAFKGQKNKLIPASLTVISSQEAWLHSCSYSWNPTISSQQFLFPWADLNGYTRATRILTKEKRAFYEWRKVQCS